MAYPGVFITPLDFWRSWENISTSSKLATFFSSFGCFVWLSGILVTGISVSGPDWVLTTALPGKSCICHFFLSKHHRPSCFQLLLKAWAHLGGDLWYILSRESLNFRAWRNIRDNLIHLAYFRDDRAESLRGERTCWGLFRVGSKSQYPPHFLPSGLKCCLSTLVGPLCFLS